MRYFCPVPKNCWENIIKNITVNFGKFQFLQEMGIIIFNHFTFNTNFFPRILAYNDLGLYVCLAFQITAYWILDNFEIEKHFNLGIWIVLEHFKNRVEMPIFIIYSDFWCATSNFVDIFGKVVVFLIMFFWQLFIGEFLGTWGIFGLNSYVFTIGWDIENSIVSLTW